MSNQIFLIRRNNDGSISKTSALDLNLIYGESGSLALTKNLVTVEGPYGSEWIETFSPITGINSVVIGGNNSLKKYPGSFIRGDLNQAGPDSISIGRGSLVSGCGAVAVGGGGSYAVRGAVLLAGFGSQGENFSVVGGGGNFSSGSNNVVFGSNNATTTKSRDNIILGGRANTIADTSENNLRPGLWNGSTVLSGPMRGPNSDSPTALYPENSIIGAGSRNVILSGKNNFIAGGSSNFLGSSTNAAQDSAYPIPDEYAAQTYSGNEVSNNNVVLGGNSAKVVRGNNVLTLGANNNILTRQSNMVSLGNIYPAFKIGSSDCSTVTMGCNSALSSGSVVIGGCFNTVNNYIPRPAGGSWPYYWNQDIGIENPNSTIIGGSDNDNCSSNSSIFGSNNVIAISGKNNLVFGTSYNIGPTSPSVQDPIFGGVSGVVVFSDSCRFYYPGTTIPNKTKRATLYEEDSNTLRLNFQNGIFLKSISGIILNGKKYKNIRSTVTVNQDPNSVLGLLI